VINLLNKAPSKGGKEVQRERTEVQPKSTQTQRGSLGAKEQIMFQSSRQWQEAYHKKKRKGNLKMYCVDEFIKTTVGN
jgi:hypothetical protein